MSPKDLRRPAAAHAAPDVIGDILGDHPARAATLPLSAVYIVPGFNPRTAALPDDERARLFDREALAELSESIGEMLPGGEMRGIIQPLLVRPTDKNEYALVAGERRYHAARLAGLERVPVLIRDLSEEEALAAAIIENAQREDLDMVSEAFAGFRMMTLLTGLDEAALIRHLNAVRQGESEDTHGLDARLRALFGTGISTWSQQRAKILRLSDAERRAVQQRRLEAKTVFPLLRLGEDAAARQRLLDELLTRQEKPSSRDAQALVDQLLDTAAPPDRAATLRRLLPRLSKLRGKQASKAEKLLGELQKLLEE